MASLLQYTLHAVRAPMNAAAFYLRGALPSRRGLPQLPHEGKEEAFSYLPAAARAACATQAAALCERYRLQDLRDDSPTVTWRECLALLEGLERLGVDHFDALRGEVRAVDVGAADWHYVFGLERFLRWSNAAVLRDVTLEGVELDGRVRCRDLRCRADHARARAQRTGNSKVTYTTGDFAKGNHRDLDVVTMFYPFVTPYAFLAWGLPVYHFKPNRLMQRAVDALRPGGLLVTFHQTLEERVRLLELVDELPVRELSRANLATDLVHYREDTQERCALLLQRC